MDEECKAEDQECERAGGVYLDIKCEEHVELDAEVKLEDIKKEEVLKLPGRIERGVGIKAEAEVGTG